MPAANTATNNAEDTAATPLARRMAAQAGLDIAAIPGSGSHGKVTRADVEAALPGGGNGSATITRQPSGDCRLSTSAGTVTVTLAEGIAVDVDARTSIGGVSSDFSIDGTVGRNSIRGSINGGGPELHLRTSAGSIRIRRS